MSALTSILVMLPSLVNGLLPTPAPGESNLGYIILLLFLSPVVGLIVASAFGKPRNSKVLGILIGVLGLLTFGFIFVVFILSGLLGIFF